VCKKTRDSKYHEIKRGRDRVCAHTALCGATS
jgi:hypothetical protein